MTESGKRERERERERDRERKREREKINILVTPKSSRIEVMMICPTQPQDFEFLNYHKGNTLTTHLVS